MEGDGVAKPITILGTRKVIRVYQGECDICGKTRVGISTDSSDWEYEDILLCFPCIKELFEHHG